MLESRPCKFPHRIIATENITLGNGVTIPEGTFGWLIGHTHVWNEPDVEFDGFGVAGITGGLVRTVRDNGHLIRRDSK